MRALGRRLARFLRGLPPAGVLAIGWLVLVIYAYPGMMTQDSFDHLREVRDRIYTDAHPPAINVLWKVADYIVAGPFGMLVFQATLFLAGLYLLLRRTFEPRPAAWIATGVYLFPPITMPMVVIWKDAPMAGFLTLGVAALLSPRARVQVAGLGALACATAVRYNAFAATAPLIVLLFEWPAAVEPATRLKRWLRRYAIAIAAWTGTTAAAFGFNAAITDHKMYLWHTIALYDIAGTLAFVDDDLPDADLRELLAGTELQVDHDIHGAIRNTYSTRDFLPLVVRDKFPNVWTIPINGYVPPPPSQRAAIERAFWTTITRFPAAYAKHRASVMAEILCLTAPRPAGAIRAREFAFPDYVKSLGMGTGWSKLQVKLTSWMSRLWKKTPIFVPWCYVAISLLLLPLAWRQRDMLALVLSGLGLESSLLLLAASPDYRYSHWMIVSTVLSVIVVTTRRARGGALVGESSYTPRDS